MHCLKLRADLKEIKMLKMIQFVTEASGLHAFESELLSGTLVYVYFRHNHKNNVCD